MTKSFRNVRIFKITKTITQILMTNIIVLGGESIVFFNKLNMIHTIILYFLELPPKVSLSYFLSHK